MKFATTKSLQRDYGLPFATAETILREQSGLARKHYRVWFALSGVALVLTLVSTFVIDKPFSHFPFNFVFAFTCLCTGIGELLTQRRAQAAIHSAARAASAHTG